MFDCFQSFGVDIVFKVLNVCCVLREVLFLRVSKGEKALKTNSRLFKVFKCQSCHIFCKFSTFFKYFRCVSSL